MIVSKLLFKRILGMKCIPKMHLIRGISSTKTWKPGPVLLKYQEKIANKELEEDEFQAKVVLKLDVLDQKLANYSPVKPTFLRRLFSSGSISRRGTSEDQHVKGSPRGVYLYGSVGCGKTMLMDLFFEYCSVPDSDKKRIHFHSFMLDVHNRIHEQKQKQDNFTSSRKALSYNPIPAVARDLVDEAWLLCLDEFQVTDIGDAMILKQVFEHLYANGSVIVATSNRAPDDLYKNGLQRHAFLPFIPLLKQHSHVLALDSGVDYRQKSLPSKQKIFLM